MSETILIGLLVGIGVAFLTSLFIPSIQNCGVCKRNIYLWQRSNNGILDKFHTKCYWNHDFEKDAIEFDAEQDGGGK